MTDNEQECPECGNTDIFEALDGLLECEECNHIWERDSE